MNKGSNSFSNSSHPNHLVVINETPFTSRELDILACLVNGRRVKMIAAFLSIAPKTVETHIRNIMLKLDCNSQESIINFIEKSDKLAQIKTHYISILTADLFTRSLKEVTQLMSKEGAVHLMIY